LPPQQRRREVHHIDRHVPADQLASGLVRLGQQKLGSQPRRPSTKQPRQVRRGMRIAVRSG
jgi:hypothetical protein